jgi:parvulin-like peptidyl-prolyl isomerase
MRAGGAALLAALVLGCGSGRSQRAVATVDGSPIPVAALRSALEARGGDSDGAARDQVLNEELNRLVSEEIVLNRARELGVEVTGADVDRRLERVHGPQFSDPDPEYRERLRREMLLERAALVDLGDKLAVPESALVLHFEEHRHEFAEPERVEIRQIVLDDRARAEELRARLLAGEDFAQLAGEHSIAPEAAEGGWLPPFARGELPDAFDRAFELAPGKISEVIESPYGFHIFRVEALHPPREPEFADVRERISLDLERERLEDLRRDWLRELRRNADIQVDERLLEALK